MPTIEDHIYAFSYLNNVPFSRADQYLKQHSEYHGTADWEPLAKRPDPSNVYRVTTLATQGEGSLFDALDYLGDETRHVIFDVAGTIALTERWAGKVRNVVLHGNTSPGGICITGAPMAFVDSENVACHHIMWALDEAPTKQQANAWNPIKVISLNETCRNITFNHCSVFGGDDENDFGPNHHYERNIDLANDGITVKNCIFGYGTRRWRGNHNFSLAISFGKNMRILNNLFVHNNKRSPQVYCPPDQCGEGGVIAGNVIYNHGSMAVGVIRGTFDIYNNTFIRGRNSKPNARNGVGFPAIKTDGSFQELTDYCKLYIKNNVMFNQNGTEYGRDMKIFNAETSIPTYFSDSYQHPIDRTESFSLVIAAAGTMFNHAMEVRATNETRLRTGQWINTLADIGGVPYLPEVSRRFEIPDDLSDLYV